MKRVKIIVSIIVCLSLLFMISLEISEAGHNCIGENCEICVIVAFCHDIFTKSICSVGLLLTVYILHGITQHFTALCRTESLPQSLVAEKVKQTA